MLVGEELVVGMGVMVVWLVVDGEVKVGALAKRWDTKPKT